MHKHILIVGSNSILSKHLVVDLNEEYKIDIAYSGENCGIEATNKNLNLIPLNRIFLDKKKYDSVIIISAFIPNSKEENNKKLFDVNVDLIEKVSLKFSNSKIIFCSTVSVHTPNQDAITESTLTSPISEYAISKLWAEKIIQRNCKSYIILRISSLIGLRMKENSFVPYIINQAINTGKITLFGNGNRMQNYIDAEELSKMIKICLKYEKNEVFLAVGAKSYSNTQIANFVCKYTNCEINYQGIDNSFSVEYNNSFTTKELNFTYTKSIEKSIEDIIEWKRKQF